MKISGPWFTVSVGDIGWVWLATLSLLIELISLSTGSSGSLGPGGRMVVSACIGCLWNAAFLVGETLGDSSFLRICRLLYVTGLVRCSFWSKRLLFSSARACLRLDRLVSVFFVMCDSVDILFFGGSFGSLITSSARMFTIDFCTGSCLVIFGFSSALLGATSSSSS